MDSCKAAKFVIIFSLEKIPLYGILYTMYGATYCLQDQFQGQMSCWPLLAVVVAAVRVCVCVCVCVCLFTSHVHACTALPLKNSVTHPTSPVV